jgi:hypothetical protein
MQGVLLEGFSQTEINSGILGSGRVAAHSGRGSHFPGRSTPGSTVFSVGRVGVKCETDDDSFDTVPRLLKLRLKTKEIPRRGFWHPCCFSISIFTASLAAGKMCSIALGQE